MSGAAAAAAAAARRRLLEEQEEQEMATYGSDDLAGDWEFKIVRSNTTAFRNPATLARLLHEEAQAGWVMVEKFDNTRIRFKRQRKARLNDSQLPHGFDPYRVHYGMSPAAFAALLMIVIFGVMGAVFVSIYLAFPR
jgi:hypothetical protein